MSMESFGNGIENPSRQEPVEQYPVESLNMFDGDIETIDDVTKERAFIKFNEIVENFLTTNNISFEQVAAFQYSSDQKEEEMYKNLEEQLSAIYISKFVNDDNISIDNIQLLKNFGLRKFVIEHVLEKNIFSHEGILAIAEKNKDIFIPHNKARLANIHESFDARDHREKIPEEILQIMDRFEDQYGNKGKDLVILAIAIHGIENPESFASKMDSIETVLKKYNHESIPADGKVSMGIEYEVTKSIADTYQETGAFDYKKDILLVSGSAHIGIGRDAVHEIALKPNYNPYMLMAEMKLLQEGGFLDLNFEKYTNAARGYHLSMVGDRGLYVDENMYFLNNLMTMAQLTGITAGKEIKNTKGIANKSFEHFSDSLQNGQRCEIKGMATDSIEQFEKAIMTAHHAGMAIQLSNKYIGGAVLFAELPDSSEAFEHMLITTDSLAQPFETDQERDMVYQWSKLKRQIVDAIGQHNESFIDSEFNGFVLKKDGTYIDTGEHIDIMRNKKLVSDEQLHSESLKKKIELNTGDLFEHQNKLFINTLTTINNIFLKAPQSNDNSPVNAKAVLETMKQEGYGDILNGKPQDSIFENEGNLREGYYYTQGASEEMIIHKSQILLNHFNKNMETLLQTKGVPREIEQDNLVGV